jgi:hypothetical protein
MRLSGDLREVVVKNVMRVSGGGGGAGSSTGAASVVVCGGVMTSEVDEEEGVARSTPEEPGVDLVAAFVS